MLFLFQLGGRTHMTHLEKLLQCIKQNHVFIQTHDFPDADAIGSAFGIQYLLKKNNINSTICYRGKIDRFYLSKMLNALNIEFFNIKDIEDITNNNSIILVDSQKGNSNLLNFTCSNVICIDHHPTFSSSDYIYSDIRPDIGACSSIIASYFFESGIEIPRNIATAILYGIKVDTANLTRHVSDLDLDMFYHTFKLADIELTQSFDMSTLQFNDLAAYAHAINSIQVYDDISFTNTGINCPEALIANISDFMLSLSEVSLSIVYSLRNDGIKLSLRSDNTSYDAGQIINLALKGIGNGGGHSTMAGGFVECNLDNGKSTRMFIAQIEERIIAAIDELCKK